jgi:uncharacterized protein (TIGR02391 family)
MIKKFDPFEFLDADISSLKAAMDSVIAGGTEDFAKWVTFKTFAMEFNRISKEFSTIVGIEPYNEFKTSSMRSANDTLWPNQKEIFEMVYIEVSKLQARMSRLQDSTPNLGFNEMLHPKILEASASHFKNGDYRNAILDGIVLLFDTIRNMSKLDLDGPDLCNNAFSVKSPKIILSEIGTQSGRNDQLGYMEMAKGVFMGVRSPNAHTLKNKLDHKSAAQYLVFLSLLVHRLDDATVFVEPPSQ